MSDLVENREAVVEEVVEDLVEKATGAFREHLIADVRVLVAPLEEPGQRQELDVRQRHEVVGAEEEVELGGIQPLDRLVVHRKVEDAEEILRVVVDLGALAP